LLYSIPPEYQTLELKTDPLDQSKTTILRDHDYLLSFRKYCISEDIKMISSHLDDGPFMNGVQYILPPEDDSFIDERTTRNRICNLV